MISEMDEYVGWVLDEVEKSGQMANTLFVYTSDHGEMGGEHGLWLKNVLLEPAARVPLIMAGAGLPAGKVVETPVSHVDMVATMLDMAGAPRPRGSCAATPWCRWPTEALAITPASHSANRTRRAT